MNTVGKWVRSNLGYVAIVLASISMFVSGINIGVTMERRRVTKLEKMVNARLAELEHSQDKLEGLCRAESGLSQP